MLIRHYTLPSALFLLTPPLGAGGLIWAAHKMSVDTQAALFSNILWPTIGAVFLAALIGWTVFLRRPTKLSDGKRAGLLTVFLCYLLGLIPLAVEAGSWDGLWGVARIYLTLFALVQVVSFWAAYPIGALFGQWIAGRMIDRA